MSAQMAAQLSTSKDSMEGFAQNLIVSIVRGTLCTPNTEYIV
jgi:hypothetical protein